MAAVVTPRLYWMLIAKPSGGFAVAAAFPSVRGILVALLIIAATTAVFPWWMGSWLAAVATGGFGHVPPALALLPLSAFLLMGIMYYRLPTGRLLFLLSLTPQLMAFYDQLLLWLIPRSGRQFVVLTAASWVGFLGWNYLPGRLSLPGPVHWSSFWILLFVFGPALALVAGQHHGWLAGSARTRTARGLDPGRATASS
jgi:hypothetical protein